MPDVDRVVEFFANVFGQDWHLHWGHSLIGVLFWTLPLCLACTYFFSRGVGPWCARAVKKSGKLTFGWVWIGVDELDRLTQKKFDGHWLWVATYSATIGIFTHFLLDLPSHGSTDLFYPWITITLPYPFTYEFFDLGTITLFGYSFHLKLNMAGLIWNIESVVLAVWFFMVVRDIKKNDLVAKWYFPHDQGEM